MSVKERLMHRVIRNEFIALHARDRALSQTSTKEERIAAAYAFAKQGIPDCPELTDAFRATLSRLDDEAADPSFAKKEAHHTCAVLSTVCAGLVVGAILLTAKLVLSRT